MRHICLSRSFSPWNKGDKIQASTEHAIAEQLQVCLFVVVYGYEDDAAVGEELLGDAEASVHKG